MDLNSDRKMTSIFVRFLSLWVVLCIIAVSNRCCAPCSKRCSSSRFPSSTSAPAPEPPKPEATTVANNSPTPEFEGSTTTAAVEEKKEGNFLMNPINKLRPSKKDSAPVDFTGAETIIQNGEIVAPSSTGSGAENAVADTGSNMPRQAPQVINGATTYSSWDDVEGTKTSAAEKILRQMR